MTKIPTPFFARVLLKRDKVNKIGSILIPEMAAGKYNPEEGIVVAVGHTVDQEVIDSIGKKVMFAKYSGAWIKVKDEEYFLCQEEDLLLGGYDE
jgi:co-chaperonin GroES (HSP10)